MQIVHGNHDPAKHVPGFLDLPKFVSLPWRKDKKIELEILKEHKKLVNNTVQNAQFRYVQLVRGLSTFGFTFFPVIERKKDKKDKNNKKGFLFGVSREKLFKVDGETRTLVQEWSLEMLKRFASSNNTIMLDFGDYEDDYIVFQTGQGDAISQLISGYIDLLVQNRQQGQLPEEEEVTDVAVVETAQAQYVMPVSSMAPTTSPMAPGITSQIVGLGPNGWTPYVTRAFANAGTINVNDVRTALGGVKALAIEIGGGLEGFDSGDSLSVDQWKENLGGFMEGMNDQIRLMLDQARMDPSKMDQIALDRTARNLHAQVVGMAVAAKNLAALDSNLPLLAGAKAISESIAKMLASVSKSGTSEAYKISMELEQAQQALSATILAMSESSRGHYIDRGAELLMLECIADLNSTLEEMTEAAFEAVGTLESEKSQKKMRDQAEALKNTKDWLLASVNAMAPVALEEGIQFSMLESSMTITNVTSRLLTTYKNLGDDANASRRLDWAAKRLNDAMRLMLDARLIAENRGAEGDLDIETPANLLTAALSQIRKNIDNPAELIAPTKNGNNAVNALIRATKTLAEASDETTRDRLLQSARDMGDQMSKLLDAVRILHKDPEDAKAKAQVLEIALRLEAAGQSIVSDAGVTAALTALRYFSKVTTAKMIKLQSAVNASFNAITDDETLENLWQLGGLLAENIDAMIEALKDATSEPENFVKQNDLLFATRANIPGFHQFLVESMRAQKHIIALNKKQDVSYAVTEANDAVKKLEKACKVVFDIGGQTEIEEALEDFDAVNTELDAAEFAAENGLLTPIPGQSRENAQELLALATRSLVHTVELLAESARLGGKLSSHVKDAASAIAQVASAVRSMAATVADPNAQLKIVAAAKDLTADTLQLIGSGRVLILDRHNAEKLKFVDMDLENVKSSVADLMAAAKGLDAREVDEAIEIIMDEIEDLSASHPAPPTFRVASESVASLAKALVATVSQLVAVTRTNPRGVGASAKVTASTVVQMFPSVSMTATVADSDLSEELLKATRDLGNALIKLLNAAKSAAATLDAASLEALNNAAQKVNDKIQVVVTTLGAAVSPEVEDAIKLINEALLRLDDPINAATSRLGLLQEITSASHALGNVTTRLITAARAAAAKLGVYSKEAAATVGNLVDTVRASRSTQAAVLSVCADEMTKYCEYLSSKHEQSKLASVAAKVATTSKTLIATGKDLATSLSGAENKATQAEIIKAIKSIAASSVSVFKNAQTAADRASRAPLAESAHALLQQTQDLVKACNSSSAANQQLDEQSSERLSEATQNLGETLIDLIRASAAVAVNKASEQASAELSKATKAVTEAITALVKAASSLNPGILECTRAEAHIRAISEDLDKIGSGKAQVPASSKSHSKVQEELVETCKNLAGDVVALAQASASSATIQAFVDSAKKVQQHFTTFQTQVKEALGTTADPAAKKSYIDSSKVVVEQALGLLKQLQNVNQSEDVTAKIANNAEQAIGFIVASLQSGAGLVSDIDAAISVVKTQSENLKNSMDAPKKRYGQYREEVGVFVSRDLAELVQKITNTTAEAVGQLSLHTKRIADIFPALVTNTRGAAATTSDAQARPAIVAAAALFSQSVIQVMEKAKCVAQDSQDPATFEALRSTTSPFTTETAKLIAALKRGAFGEVMCDNAIASVQKSITHVNTTALFAQAGQLEADKAALSLTILQLQDALVAAATSVGTSSRSVSDATKKTQDALGNEATTLAKHYADVTTHAIRTASRAKDSAVQQDLLAATKTLGLRSYQLLLAAKDVERAPTDSTVISTLSQATTGVQEAVSALCTTAAAVVEAAGLGERELENARKAVMALIQSAHGYDLAAPEDVLKNARDASVAIQNLVFAFSQEEIVAGAQKALGCVDRLLNSAVTVSKAAPTPLAGKKIMDSVTQTAQAMAALFEVAKLSVEDPETQAKREASSAAATTALEEVVRALRALPGCDHFSLDEGADLESVANAELLKAAKVIEEAAAILNRARPQRAASAESGVLDSANVVDGILGAAQAIAQATGDLVKDATSAQAERTKKQKDTLAPGQKYRDDPTWANGLISAAKAVANAVRQLVNASNEAAQGNADEVVLVVSARTVAAATAQLVAACRAKADPLSRAQQSLSSSAKGVATSTSNLVRAAQELAVAHNIEEIAEQEANVTAALSSTQKYNQQIKILQLEAEIEAERRRLAKMNKAEYGK